MDYKREIEIAVAKKLIARASIFDYEGMPYEDFYANLYDFCRTNLNTHIERKSIPDCSFLYADDRDINAKAYKEGIIAINIGLMVHCITKYHSNVALNDYLGNANADVVNNYDSSVSHLAYQVCTQFTYYHELAHIIQFTGTAQISELQERSGGGDFDITKQRMEINADTYSAACIATHIIQYIEKTFGENTNKKSVEDTIIIIGTCLLDYIISFADRRDLYFAETTHPHPLLRMLNIILSITNHLSEIPIYRGKGIELDAVALLVKAIDLYKELEGKGIFDSENSALLNITQADSERILAHFTLVGELGDSVFLDAITEFNKYAVQYDPAF